MVTGIIDDGVEPATGTFILGDTAWSALPNVKRWFDHVSARPAAQRANALKDKFEFKSDMDEEARRHMFRHLASQ
jgi:GSH-dependent disulfide-bond oxidoreductase